MIEAKAHPLGKDEPDGSRYRRHSIFEQATAESLPAWRGQRPDEPSWVEDARLEIEERGQFLAFSDDGETHVVRIREGWTRIGRSAVADIRLDDETVSRRHALLIWEERGLRVLDDRSLNGVYVNGGRVEWGALVDGDELQIGRYRLFVIDSSLISLAS
jgi:pSer/pThr/pTyr-binding forkhead associated (FHA) protein